MKKRMICLLLSLLLGIASFGCVGLAAADSGTEPKAELEELVSIGVITQAQAGLSWDSEITRAQMAKILVNLLKLEPQNGQFGQKFSDVTPETDAYHAIMAMVNLGYMSGYGDGTFRPENPITGMEAGKIMVHILGYKYKAVTGGGYPAGYLACASEIELSKGVVLSYTEPLKWGGLVKLVSNALEIPLVELIAVGDSEKYQTNPDVTLLSKYLKMRREKGVVTANDLTGIQGNDRAPEDKISIDGVVYTPRSPKDRNLLGLQVSYIYRLDDDLDAHQLVSIVERNTKKQTVTSQEYSRLDGNTVYFDRKDASSEQRITFDVTADIIYNGERAVYSQQLFDQVKAGTFEFISTTNSSYDLVLIRDYHVMTVGQIDRNKKILTDDQDHSIKISLDDTEKTVLVYDANGNEVNFSFISTYDVLTYMDNSNYIEVYVGSETVSGEVSSLSADGEDSYVTIGEKVYQVNPYIEAQYQKLKTGDLIKGTLDHMGYIADISILNKNGLEYMYLIQLDDGDSKIDPQIRGKFYSTGRGISIHTLKDPLRINGSSYKNLTLDQLKTMLGNPLDQLVSVKLDEENRIVQMDIAQDLKTLEESISDGFCRTHKLMERKVFKDPWSFSRSIYLTNATQLLMIPKDLTTADDKDFKVASLNYLVNDRDYLTEAYNRTKNYEIPEVIIVRTDAGAGSAPQFKLETPAVIVKSVVQTVNAEGDIVKRIKVQNGSKENFFDIDADAPVTCVVKKGTAQERTVSVNDLAVGDIIRYSKDNSDYIRLLEVYWDESEKEWTGTITEGDKNGIFPTTISRRSGDYMFVPHWFVAEEDYGVLYLKEQTLSIGGISVIEEREGRDPYIRAGSTSDVEKDDRIVLQIAYGQLITIIVYK